jgi:3-phenylpropionate/trans-cinnamate dioxygenase ferredoxin reductase subunit
LNVLVDSDHVVVVGAGLAGWRFIEALRREGYAGALTLVGDESHLPYDRPPLSKQVLVGKWTVEQATLASDDELAGAAVRLFLGTPATGLDVATTTVHLADDTAVAGTHVVIATGSRARLLAFSAGRHLHTVRSIDDVVRLNVDLAPLDSESVVAVIGGGFIGAEVATALRTRGLRPVILEAAERPLINVLGPEVSSWLEGLPAAAGIELRTRQAIVDVEGSDGDFRVLFTDGCSLEARAVVVGAGAVPNVEWLATSGLSIENGVVVDEHLFATERVAAIGDVARFEWMNVAGSELTRIEHWQIANDHAGSLARYWTSGVVQAKLLVPYFWSDQYAKKIQLLGHPRPSDDVTMVDGSVDDAKWVALYSRDGLVTGVVTLSQPRGLMLSKHFLETPTQLDEALVGAPWAN